MLRTILLMVLCLPVAGCTNIFYYAQAAKGQINLMAAMRPITEVVSDAATESGLRQRLEQTIAIREFASRELALPNNGSYRSYADLGRPFVVWNVFAAPEFSVEPQHWCFVFTGCINYRGYYDKSDAESYANELRHAGADAYIGGVTAYSTLGYFNDPVLNTFLRSGDLEVSRIIFHELAHQLVYAKDDTTFNESFATAVENEGMRRWLVQSPERLHEFEMRQERKVQFYRLLANTRDKLRAIYASTLSPDAKRSAKAEAFAAMQRTYADLKSSWGGYGGYDQWFNQPMNNAALGSVMLYTQWVPAFHALLKQEGGNLPHFYHRVTVLAGLPETKRRAALDQLLQNRTASPGKIDHNSS